MPLTPYSMSAMPSTPKYLGTVNSKHIVEAQHSFTYHIFLVPYIYNFFFPQMQTLDHLVGQEEG